MKVGVNYYKLLKCQICFYCFQLHPVLITFTKNYLRLKKKKRGFIQIDAHFLVICFYAGTGFGAGYRGKLTHQEFPVCSAPQRLQMTCLKIWNIQNYVRRSVKIHLSFGEVRQIQMKSFLTCVNHL